MSGRIGLHPLAGALYSKPNSLKGGNAMCDYSLAHYPNRLAEEGDQLLTCRFSSGTLGLTFEQLPFVFLRVPGYCCRTSQGICREAWTSLKLKK